VASTFSRRNAEIDRFFWHSCEPFDDAQLTALSNLCEPSSSAAATPSTATATVLAPLNAAGDLPTQRRARAGSVSSRISTVFRRTAFKPATPTPSSPAAVATAAGGSPSVPRHAVVDNLKSQGRSRLASLPVRPQFNVTELVAAGKQADLENERLRLKALAAKCVVELAREDTAAATAATQAVSSEQLNSSALRGAVGKRAQEIFGALKFECVVVTVC
jgi:hypothetical protein